VGPDCDLPRPRSTARGLIAATVVGALATAAAIGAMLAGAAAAAGCRGSSTASDPVTEASPPPATGAPAAPGSRAAHEAAAEPLDGREGPTALASTGVAWVVVDAASGAIVSAQRADVLDRPVLPGPLAKIVTPAAAVDAGLVDEATRLTCARRVRVDATTLDCAHPLWSAPAAARTALADSCNSFFFTLATRLPPAVHASAARALGLPAASPDDDLRLAAVGLAGAGVPPRRWIDVLQLVARGEPVAGVSNRARAIVAEGLRDAARTGTAAAFGRHGIDALAKTGTTRTAAGDPVGLVVAAWPAGGARYALALAVAGGAGRDAAEFAANLAVNVTGGRALVTTESAPRPSPALHVGRVRDRAYAVESMPLEDYVAGVVAAEAPPGAPQALLDALAILARTYAWGHRGRHQDEGFDVCDLTHCQALGRPTAASTAAAARTRHALLLERDEVAEVYYTADCGGMRASPDEVWPASRARELAGGPDPVSHPSPEWTSDVSLPQLHEALLRAGWRGDRLVGVKVVARSASGRALRVALDGLTPRVVDGEAFRLAVGRTLGWHVLKSAAFDASPTAAGVRFTGRGRGHGVGLCVAGAHALAAATADAPAVLGAYFPSLDVGPLLEVTLDLPLAVEGERARLRAFVLTTIRRLADLIGVEPPWTIAVRVHPTVGSYERATGMPWWSAGTVIGGRVELLPLDALAGRRQVERTLRHELVHALTVEWFAGRPRWVHEGAAVYYAAGLGGETVVAAPADASCPSDTEFSSARTAAALAVLHRRAAACYARDHGGRSRP
jgi:SpoIID/LytB domain protein